MKIIQRQSFFPKDNQTNWKIDPVLSSIFRARGITDIKELIYDIKKLLPPVLKGINEASNIIADAIMQDKKIRVVGDYDADGATSTALAMRFFRDINYQYIDYYIPNRHDEGYGINKNIVEQAHNENIDLIITVDNGISAIDEIQLAKQYQIKVVITDHHIPMEKLPVADAIVNPKQTDCPFESKNLAGVGVIFYVLTVVRTVLRERGFFSATNCSIPIMSNYLDLVAIGTIADMVSMDYNNRLMCNYGINLIRNKNTSYGLEELIKVTGSSCQNFKSSDISFALSPRLNAAGRLADMKYGVDCLLASNVQDAKVSANLLHVFNTQRKDIESKMMRLAVTEIEQQPNNTTKSGIVICGKNFNIGVVGIIAAKLKDKYQKPVIVFTETTDGFISGSGRSVEGYNIHEGLTRINENTPNLIDSFGGHKGAAGITIRYSNLSEFEAAFLSDIETYMDSSENHGIVYISDGVLPPSYFTPSFARALVYDQPWGCDFPIPDFDGVFLVVKQVAINGRLLRLNLRLEDGSNVWAMYFNYDTNVWPNSNIRMIHAVYCFDISKNSDDTAFNLIIRGVDILE